MANGDVLVSCMHVPHGCCACAPPLWLRCPCSFNRGATLQYPVDNRQYENPRNRGDPGAEVRLDPLGAFGGAASRTFRDL
jgi:hypothetical protein